MAPPTYLKFTKVLLDRACECWFASLVMVSQNHATNINRIEESFAHAELCSNSLMPKEDWPSEAMYLIGKERSKWNSRQPISRFLAPPRSAP